MIKSYVQFIPNQLQTDSFGRPNGVLLINKPAGPTSHDIVDRVRKTLGTRAVGHAGALDPFASGLLIVLVGKATKLSDTYLNHDKDYMATVLFGISTTTADPEGEVLETSNSVSLEGLDQALEEFKPGYDQYVPVFSSVKVNGVKLREIARKSSQIEFAEQGSTRIAKFHVGATITEVEIPKHYCNLMELSVQSLGTASLSAANLRNPAANLDSEYPIARLKIRCSKGTYIRALAEDIGKKLQPVTPAMLIELTRDQIGEFTLDQAITLEQLAALR